MTTPPPPRGPVDLAVDVAVRLAILGLFAWLALSLVAPFGVIIAWAVILAVAANPAHDALSRRLGGRKKLAAALLTVAGLAIIFGPITVLAASLVGTLEHVTAQLIGGDIQIPGPVERLLEWQPLGPALHAFWSQSSGNLTAFFKDYGHEIAGVGTFLLGSALHVVLSVIGFSVAVVLAGFLLNPGPGLAVRAQSLADNVFGARGAHVLDLTGRTIGNVAQGVIGVSLLQALLIGAGLMVAGVPAYGLLTLVAAVLGVIQIGQTVLVAPILIWAWIERDPTSAILLGIWLVPIGLIDNLLKPMLMARGLDTPMPVILLGVLGGTLSYGLIGLFLGPIVLAVFYEVLLAWGETPRASAPAPADDPPDAG